MIANPIWLLLLLLLPLFIALHKREGGLNISSSALVKPRVMVYLVRGFQCLAWIVVFALLVFILARPLIVDEGEYEEKEVRQICITVDTSGSMTSPMFKMKKVLEDFAKKRKGDQMAVVIYGGHTSGAHAGASAVIRPLTCSVPDVVGSIKTIRAGTVGSMTAIGEGMLASIMALVEGDIKFLREKTSLDLHVKDFRDILVNQDTEKNVRYLDFFCEQVGQQKGRVIVLFTDGDHNTGLPPSPFVRLASRLGIKVYMIEPGSSAGAGKDRRELKQVIKETGGKIFNYILQTELDGIYSEIDQLEKRKIFIKEIEELEDNYGFFASIALLIFLSRILSQYIWIKYP